ncbi:MAG TPA: hypothetical protein VFQ23_24010 [Anaerolineales bacterium]|nr:hypothetical protein [Anaerolineales bacterium]
MAEKIYFQWQNPVLRKTIYPRRDLKLQHFLLYYKEIDLWAEHRNKKIEDFSKDKEEFEKNQKAEILAAYQSEQLLRDYFKKPMKPSVPETASKRGKDEMDRFANLIAGMHTAFGENFVNYEQEEDESRDRKEKYFVTQRLEEWDGYLNDLRRTIVKNISKDLNALEFLEKTLLPIFEVEHDNLKAFVSAQAKLEKRKAEFAKRKKENTRKAAEINRVLEPLQKQMEIWGAELGKITATIARLTNPRKVEDVLEYLKQDLYVKIQRRFEEGQWKVEESAIQIIKNTVHTAFDDVIESLQKGILPFIGTSDPGVLKQLVKSQSEKTRKAQKQLDKEINKLDSKIESLRILLEEKMSSSPDDLQGIRSLEDKKRIHQNASSILDGSGMREILQGEVDTLDDLYVAIDFRGHDKAKWNEKIKDEEAKLEKLQKNIAKNEPDVAKSLKELEPILSVLEIGREKFLSEFILDREIDVRDIVLYLTEKERARLEGLTSDELLNEVFQRFWKEPERFPLWLQYMVIHFSGMRYASAHDSWYDPRALLLDLWTMDIQEGLKNNDDDPSNDTDYKIESLTDEQVLEKLKTYKSQLPKWMWKEIVEVTDLRLTEVTNPDEDWETLSSDEQKERNSARDKKTGQYLKIMEKWKKNKMTGWRKEHDRANRLVVTRAVCNEVAEHIQHLRGHEGAAGLAEKPNWYMGEESKYYESKERKPGSRPYFVKAKGRNDFEVGASILWLRFVHESPDQWRKAKALETRAGDGLIPQAYLGRSIDSGSWAYKMDDPIVRTRIKATTNNTKGSNKGSRGGKENQWLRWMHEATVVEVAETAETKGENRVVLTFETDLPSEDPSRSTMGLVKRYLSDLTREQVEDSYNAAFVGYMPEAKLGADAAVGLASDLEVMLDWNHILQREVVSAAEMETYRSKYIRNRKPPKPTIEIIDTPERVKGKADLPICEFVKWTDSLATKDNNLWKVRIWGDDKLKLVGLTTTSAAVQEKAPSNFQAVGLYDKETRQRGAVSNFLKIERDEIDELIAMQIEDEFKRKQSEPKRSSRKQLEIWRQQKMRWLCKGEGTIYFTKGGKGWENASFILWGTVSLGGNLVQVEGEEEIEFKTAEGKKKMRMARLAGFTKSHWSWPLDELLAQGLVHRCFCALPGDKPTDTPQGIVYSPFFSPRNRDFSGQAKPSAFYLPFDQLVKPDDKDYVGIRQRLKCKE